MNATARVGASSISLDFRFIDWFVVVAFFAISLLIGLVVSKRAGRSSSEYFLSGRTMSWWLLGISMVASTTSDNTGNLFTDIIRQNGISGNWVWWVFLLTGMLTVFVYARLWRRSAINTDLQFYELRYSGKAATFLRGFRAIYAGALMNTISMAWVTLAVIKIGQVMFGFSAIKTVILASAVTVTYTMLGGLRGLVIADLFQFLLAMVGIVVAAVVVLRLPEVGGLANLFSHPNVVGKLNFVPDVSNTDVFVAVFMIPLAVQWWSVLYPGSEPGGGGSLNQRLLAARNEKQALWAALSFNIVNYGLRPWPFFIIALSSLAVFPNLAALRAAFPHVDPQFLGDDAAFPAMLTFIPPGLKGLMVASLLGLHMSTVAGQLNCGSFYVVNDFYKRFVRRDAGEKELVLAGRVFSLLLMIAACVLAPFLLNAKRAFDLVVQVGAGTGLVFILRWFWWRINAFSEITAMAVSFVVACYFELIHAHTGLPQLAHWQRLLLGVGITTLCWLTVTLLTRPANDRTLVNFCRLVQPGGPGWKAVVQRASASGITIEGSAAKWDVPHGILCLLFGCIAVYSCLFATGMWIYGRHTEAAMLAAVAVVATLLLTKSYRKLTFHVSITSVGQANGHAS